MFTLLSPKGVHVLASSTENKFLHVFFFFFYAGYSCQTLLTPNWSKGSACHQWSNLGRPLPSSVPAPASASLSWLYFHFTATNTQRFFYCFVNGRQPQLFCKWKTDSVIFKQKITLISFRNTNSISIFLYREDEPNCK